MKHRRQAQAPALEDREVLLFGAAARGALAEAARVPATKAPERERVSRAQRAIPYYGEYRLRGRWLLEDYTQLRNAAWAVRNSRVGAQHCPLALRLVLAEAERLVAAGEPLLDVLEAFAELLSRP